MNKTVFCFLLVLVIALPLLGQVANPQPKSQEEVDGLMAIQNAADADARIAAADQFLKNFKNSDFREMATFMIMVSYQQKNDFENMLLYGEKILELNPENAGALIALSSAIPMRTREFDLDKEAKLAKAEDYAKKALIIIPNLPKPNPDMTDEEWLAAKKDYMSQSHEALGMVALKRKDFPAAEESFQQALQVGSEQIPTIFFNMGMALKEQGKHDQAIAMLDKCIEKGGYPMGDGRDAAVLLKAEIQKAQKKAAQPQPAPQPAPESQPAPEAAPQPAPQAAELQTQP